MSTTFVSFTMTATAREGGEEAFSSAVWQIISAPGGGASLTVASAEGSIAVLSGPTTARTDGGGYLATARPLGV